MYWGMEQGLPKRRTFTLTIILTPLRFSPDILAGFEGQLMQQWMMHGSHPNAGICPKSADAVEFRL
jgi:hypothetical protein